MVWYIHENWTQLPGEKKVDTHGLGMTFPYGCSAPFFIKKLSVHHTDVFNPNFIV